MGREEVGRSKVAGASCPRLSRGRHAPRLKVEEEEKMSKGLKVGREEEEVERGFWGCLATGNGVSRLCGIESLTVVLLYLIRSASDFWSLVSE